MSKIKALHTADIHIGMENYGYLNPNTGLNTRLEDFLKSFDVMVDYAIDNEIDIFIFAGDAFKTQSPTPTQHREFAKRIYRLAKANIPTVLLAGNHDLPNRYGEATSVNIYETLSIDNVYVMERPTFQVIKTKNGDVQVLGIPYVSKSGFLTNEEYSGKSLEEIENILLKKIDSLIDGYIAKADKEIPLVLTFHAGIDRAVMGAEKDLMIGKAFCVPLSVVAKKGIDYVALGHIHKYQVLCKEPPVIYSGSIERVDFGEEPENKGFVIINLEKNNTSFEFVKLPARKFITIDAEIKDNEDPNEIIIKTIAMKDVQDAIVRLRYSINTSLAGLVDDNKIKDALNGSFFHTINATILDNAFRMRDPNLNETISNSPITALEKYLVINEDLNSLKDDLLERANSLMSEAGE